MALDLQSEYNDQSQPAPADQSQAQDVTIPAAAAAQIAQAIQGQDCDSLMKLMAGVLSGGQPSGDSDQDGM